MHIQLLYSIFFWYDFTNLKINPRLRCTFRIKKLNHDVIDVYMGCMKTY